MMELREAGEYAVKMVNTLILLIQLYTPPGEPCQYYFSSTNDLEGTFTSPNWPEPYGTLLQCRYIFQGTMDERIKLEFEIFDLQAGTQAGCRFDYVDIFMIDLARTKHFHDRLCGTKVPAPIISIHQRVELVFKSHYIKTDINHKGFRGKFKFVDERWQPFPTPHPSCGEDFLIGVGGMIQSPSFPQPYADHIQCTWMIRVDYDRRILLNFIDMDLGQGLHCKETYLAVHDGFAAKDGVPATKRCGQAYFLKKGESEFKSKNHRVVIRFMSGENEDRSTGFRIAWTAVKLPDLKQDKNGNWYEEACEGFHCEGGEYCIDTSGLLCNPLPRYCIAKSLQCNGVPNCGASDHSDENGCYKQIITIIGAIAGFVLTTASVSGITIFCMRRQKRIKKEKQNEALNMTLEKLESSPSLKRHVGPFNDVQDSPRKNPVAAYGVVEWCNSNNYHHNTISPESARVDYMSIRRSSPARSPIAVRLGGGRAPHAYHMVVCSDSDESHSVTV